MTNHIRSYLLLAMLSPLPSHHQPILHDLRSLFHKQPNTETIFFFFQIPTLHKDQMARVFKVLSSPPPQRHKIYSYRLAQMSTSAGILQAGISKLWF